LTNNTADMGSQPDRSSDILEAVALLVVDMQGSFLAPIANAEPLLVRCGLAVASARALGIKVLFTEQVPEKLGHTDPRLLALAPGARVFPKDSFSALQAPGLQEHLKKLGVYHLLLIGIETPICIYQTALHARDSDFDVTVLSDCIGGRRPSDCQVAIDSVARVECHVLPAETVFYSMLASSTHRSFGKFTELVKKFGSLPALEKADAPAPAAKQKAPRPARKVQPVAKSGDAPEADEKSTETARKPIKRPRRRSKAKETEQQPEETKPAAPPTAEGESPAPKKRSRGRRGGRSRRGGAARKTDQQASGEN
jgi:nicotinamidase-related amidase